MNQHEEQQQELEALSSIYPEELEGLLFSDLSERYGSKKLQFFSVLSSEFPASFNVYLKSDDYDAATGAGSKSFKKFWLKIKFFYLQFVVL